METTAHWIYVLNTASDGSFYGGKYRCSHCEAVCLGKYSDYPSRERFCHDCGAHMIETPVMEIEEYKGDEYSWE